MPHEVVVYRGMNTGQHSRVLYSEDDPANTVAKQPGACTGIAPTGSYSFKSNYTNALISINPIQRVSLAQNLKLDRASSVLPMCNVEQACLRGTATSSLLIAGQRVARFTQHKHTTRSLPVAMAAGDRGLLEGIRKIREQ
jgi:hypothetical protein